VPSLRAAPPSGAQQNLLDAAIDAFAELGFGGTSTRDIAARAGRSPSAVYIHYSSKEEVLFAVSLRGHVDAMDALVEATSAREPARRLADMVFAFSSWHLRHSQRGRVVQYEFHALTREHQVQIADLRRQIRKVVVDVIEEGIATGVFEADDPRQAADAVLSLSIDVVRWFDPARTGDRDEVARTHADLAVRMLRPQTTPDRTDS